MVKLALKDHLDHLDPGAPQVKMADGDLKEKLAVLAHLDHQVSPYMLLPCPPGLQDPKLVTHIREMPPLRKAATPLKPSNKLQRRSRNSGDQQERKLLRAEHAESWPHQLARRNPGMVSTGLIPMVEVFLTLFKFSAGLTMRSWMTHRPAWSLPLPSLRIGNGSQADPVAMMSMPYLLTALQTPSSLTRPTSLR